MSKLTEKLQIDYPIILAPMAGGLIAPEFVAQVSNRGLLGSVPGGYLSLDQLRAYVQAVKAQTSRAFVLNLFVDYAVYNHDIALLKPPEITAIEREYDPESADRFHIPPLPSMDDLIRLAIDEAVPAVSTTFGLLNPCHITRLKTAGIRIITTVNNVYELALAVATQQPDAVVYQSEKAGGHKGGCTPLPYSSEAEIITALTQTNRDIPCILAGGVVTAEDAAAAFSKGFAGVQIGTGFLATRESLANEAYKLALCNRSDTAFTDAVTGRTARGLINRIASLQVPHNLGFPFMHYATSSLRKLAKSHNDPDCQSLWCGAGVSRIRHIPALDDYIQGLIA